MNPASYHSKTGRSSVGSAIPMLAARLLLLLCMHSKSLGFRVVRTNTHRRLFPTNNRGVCRHERQTGLIRVEANSRYSSSYFVRPAQKYTLASASAFYHASRPFRPASYCGGRKESENWARQNSRRRNRVHHRCVGPHGRCKCHSCHA